MSIHSHFPAKWTTAPLIFCNASLDWKQGRVGSTHCGYTQMQIQHPNTMQHRQIQCCGLETQIPWLRAHSAPKPDLVAQILAQSLVRWSKLKRKGVTLKSFRTVLGAPSGSPPEHDYESLVSSPGSSCSQMQTLDVRIKVTRAVMRESGEFDGGSDGGSDRAENGCSVYDNITVRDGQDNDSWQYTTRIPQVRISHSPWRARVLLRHERKSSNLKPVVLVYFFPD